MNARRSIMRFVLSLLLASGGVFLVHAERPDAGICFLEYGYLFQVHPRPMELSVLGMFHPAAPSAARAPDGLYWARRGERELAALDLASGRIVASVRLAMRPYDHVIAANGKAYVTHHTLTREGFWISVVDTANRSALEPIKGVEGLRCDIEAGERCVYLCTMEVGEPHTLRLYAIDTQRDEAQTLFSEIPEGYDLRLAFNDGLLYICRTGPLQGRDFAPIRVMDTASGRISVQVPATRLEPISRITGKMVFDRGYAYLPCAVSGNEPAIARLSLPDLEVDTVYRSERAVWRILGLVEDRLIFIGPEQTERGDISLVFYDLGEEREVKRISLVEFLKDTNR